MKKITSLVLLSVLLVLCSVVPFHAVSIYTDGDWSYADVDENNVALYAYSGESTVLTVPALFSGRAVSEVYDYAFENNATITALDFSQNGGRMKNLGIKCFAECTGLSGELRLPSSVRKIGLGAFQGCTGLTSLTVNTGVREIPRQCFNRCASLETVYLPSDLETIGDLAFANCGSLNAVYIPRSVTEISENAFSKSDPTLFVNYDSYAYYYAKEHRLEYQLTDNIMRGDANGDGFVNINDVTVLQRYVAELDVLEGICLYAADTNQDGTVTIDDATSLQMYLAEYDIPSSIGKVITK